MPLTERQATCSDLKPTIDGDTIVIGAEHDDYNGFEDIGSAYVYTRDGGTWSLQAKLLSSNGNDNDDFGSSVSVSGERILVAAGNADFEGVVHVFVRNAGNWTLEAQLLAFDGGNGAGYATSVDLDGNLAIVGAKFDDDSGDSSGSVYAYRQDGGVWFHEGKFTTSDGQPGDRFGQAIALSGELVISSAYHDDDPINGDQSGSAYIFNLGCTSCPPDINSDGSVDFFDLQGFLNWFATGDLRADFVDDGTLDFFDVQAYLGLFAAGCP
jgi:FG-GAP repeat protein